MLSDRLLDHFGLLDVEPLDVNQARHDAPGIRIGVVGRPNVGKSTLVNRMLGEDRVVVFDLPGTTRDSIYIPYKRYDEMFTLIDTLRDAGRAMRRSKSFG